MGSLSPLPGFRAVRQEMNICPITPKLFKKTSLALLFHEHFIYAFDIHGDNDEIGICDNGFLDLRINRNFDSYTLAQ